MPQRIFQKIKDKLKKYKKPNKRLFVYLYTAVGLVVFLLALISFLYFNQPPESLYIFPKNPKQGDTVFIRVKTNLGNVTGSFEKSLGDKSLDNTKDREELFFYKKPNSSEWISFLGIDADQAPGDYKISVDVPVLNNFVENIKVSPADFSSAPAATAPSAQKTGITVQKAVNNIVTTDGPALKKILGISTPDPYFNASFSFPLSKIEKVGFSFGKFINFSKDRLQHFGVDLLALKKTNVYAVNSGKIVATFDLPNYGKTVIIDHGLDIFSLYLHLEEFKVITGDIVKNGQIIGLSGDTGYVTAPHLHFSMRVGGSRVDPIGFIEVSKKINENQFLASISEAFKNIFK